MQLNLRAFKIQNFPGTHAGTPPDPQINMQKFTFTHWPTPPPSYMLHSQ